MIVGVISDTHDHLDKVKAAVELFNGEKVGLVLHAGDLVSPFVLDVFAKLEAPFKGVFGNNEGEIPLILQKSEGRIQRPPLIEEIGGIRILVKHYHHYVDELASSGKYDLVIYGHTHKVDLRRINTTVVLNPGEACGWLTGKATVALVEIPSLEIQIIDI